VLYILEIKLGLEAMRTNFETRCIKPFSLSLFMLAIFLVRGARTQKKGLKTHLSKVLDDNAPRVSHEQVRTAAIHASGSTAQVEFRTPLAFLPLSGGVGGGGLEYGAHLFNGPD
jgi:hypothetical protein